MSRPSTITTASWIWLFCGLFTTFTIANVLAATNVLIVFLEIDATADELAVVEVIGWVGVGIVLALTAAMLLQVVAAVTLRDGARWARVLLTISAFIALVTALYDITLWSAWVLLAANIVAMALAYSDSATAYLEAHRVDAPARTVAA